LGIKGIYKLIWDSSFHKHTRTDTGIVDTIEKDAHACMQFALVVDRLYSCVIYMETINIYYAIKCLARDSIITRVHHPPDWRERN